MFSMNLDLNTLLEGWPHEPGQIRVRKIKGNDGKDKIQLFFLNDRDSPQARFIKRIRLDPAAFRNLKSFKRGPDLCVNAVLLDRSATVEKKHGALPRDQVFDRADRSFAEHDLGGVFVAEILHEPFFTLEI